MISYLTQITICWGLFYLLYFIWFRKETFFNANRWYLLTTLIAGLIIPLIEFQFLPSATISEALNPAYYLETITVTAQALETNLEAVVITPVNESWSMQMILLTIYWLGVLFFASRFLYGMFQIMRLAYHGKTVKKQNYLLIETNTVHLPFSFMDYLFWSKAVEFNQEDHEKILKHELCHIEGKHSIDVLITELLCIFLWCSPFIFLYKKALKNIHEYLADNAVLQDTPTKKYGQLLLKQSQSGLQIAQANNFIHSQLKKRIIMMTKTKSQRYALLKYIAILPLALFLVFSISAENSLAAFAKETNEQLTPQDTVPLQSANTTGELGEVFKVVEEMPHFKGCENLPAAERKSCADRKMLEHIYTNIKYPAVARTSGVEGTVVTSFIIEKDGSISNAKILRDIGATCGEEVLRIVNSMPDFVPGKQRGKAVRVQFNLPVKFKLEGSSKEKKPNELLEVVNNEFTVQPLFFVDGKEVETLDNINPNDIKHINVVKGEKAIQEYGARAKNGVVVVTTIDAKINVIAMAKENNIPPPPPPEPESGNEIIRVAEVMPLFPNTSDRESSNQALLNFVYKNLSYPAEARKQKIEGTVVVSFIITKEGGTKNSKILRSIGGGTDEEVLKVIKLLSESPDKWTPATQGGKAVDIVFNLPVKFKLESKATSDKKVEAKDLKQQTEDSVLFDKIDIYPNPTNGNFNLHAYSKTDSQTTITIRDSKGTQLYKQEFNGQEIKLTDLEFKNVANGVLYVTFEKDGKIAVREVLIQK